MAHISWASIKHVIRKQTAFEPNAKYPPHEFIQERFLDEECPTTDPGAGAFSYGRRSVVYKMHGKRGR